MSLTRTDQKPYKSLCSDLYVDAANYLAELVCRRKQQKENAGALPIKFWSHPKYKNLYIREVSQARILLQKYSATAIIKALDDYNARFILSLRNKKLIPIIEKIAPNVETGTFHAEPTVDLVSSKPLPSKENILKKL